MKAAAELNLQTVDLGKGNSDGGGDLRGVLTARLGPLCTAPTGPCESRSADTGVENVNPTDGPLRASSATRSAGGVQRARYASNHAAPPAMPPFCHEAAGGCTFMTQEY